MKFRNYVPQLKFNAENGLYEIWVGNVKTTISYKDKFTREYGISSFKDTLEYKQSNKLANYNKLLEKMTSEFTKQQMALINEFMSFEENYNNPENFIDNDKLNFI